MTIIELKEINIFSEIFLSISILYILLFGTLIRYNNSKSYSTEYLLGSSLLVLFFSIILVLNIDKPYLNSTGFNNSLVIDYLSIFSKIIIGISAVIYFLTTNNYLKKYRSGQLEYVILVFLAVLGIYLLCSANDLVTAYLAIELQSLSFYLMASFNNHSTNSVESGLKYFIVGSLSSALFLFGSSIVYGISGSSYFEDYKDLFFFTFSGNSALLSSGSISKALASFEIEDDTEENDQIKNLKSILGKFKVLKRYAYVSDNDVSKIKGDFFDIFKTLRSDEKSNLYRSLLVELQNNNFDKDPYFRNLIFKERVSRVESDLNFRSNWIECFASNAKLGVFTLYARTFFENESPLKFDRAFGHPGEQTEADLGLAWVVDHGLKEELVEISKDQSETTNFDRFVIVPILFLARSMEQAHDLSVLSSVASLIPLFYEPNDTQIYDYSIFDSSLINLGLLLILSSIFIKLALAPFHTWSIDVYEGSPTSSTFFFAIISKFSFFVLLIRLCYSSLYSFIDIWQFYSLIFAVLSIIVGAITGLSQRKLKSLLAYSSISHMGYAVASFSSGTFEGVQMLICYLIIYMVAGLCLWSSILSLRLVKSDSLNKHNKDLGELSLLLKSNPILSFVLMVCLLSIAGTPPMVGFIAKMGVFLTIVGSYFYLVSLLLIIISVVSTFYYLRIVQILYFENILVGKLYYPILSQNYIIIPVLFFSLILLFVDPTMLYLISYKIVLLFH